MQQPVSALRQLLKEPTPQWPQLVPGRCDWVLWKTPFEHTPVREEAGVQLPLLGGEDCCLRFSAGTGLSPEQMLAEWENDDSKYKHQNLCYTEESTRKSYERPVNWPGISNIETKRVYSFHLKMRNHRKSRYLYHLQINVLMWLISQFLSWLFN